jgi:hypothetical protein
LCVTTRRLRLGRGTTNLCLPFSLEAPSGATYDRVEYQYNRQGQQIQVKDQNQTVHDYLFDRLGRLATDKVTVLPGSGVDASMLRIDRTDEERGMLEKVRAPHRPSKVVGNPSSSQ